MADSTGGWRDILPDFQTDEPAARHADMFTRMDALYANPVEPSVSEIDAIWCGDIGGLYDWCASTFRFLLVTRELAGGLADLCRDVGSRQCIEVGAGRGELTTALLRRDTRCIATDDKSWEARPRATNGVYGAIVQAVGYKEGIDSLQPDTIFCAWMPNHEDWTPAFRAAPSVERYILLGTGKGGITGTEEAWAQHAGWRRTDLTHLAHTARCRLDILLGTPYTRLRTAVAMYSRA